MIEDRDYMRPEFGGSWYQRLPAALWLVIVNAVVYAIQLIVPLVTGGSGKIPVSLDNYFALWPEHILHGRVWELLTFQFLHGGPFHLLINCAMLYMFGRTVEASLGRASFLKLYFLSGTLGGLVQVGLALLLPQHFGSGPVVGASAGVFGLIAAFAIIYAEQPITMLLAFILPLTMKAKYLLIVEAIMAFLGLLDPASHIAHGAHLGGMLMGVLYVKRIVHWRGLGSPRSAPRELVKAGSAQARSWHRTPAADVEDTSKTEFFSKEVDPILEKISAHGIHSLTDKERKTLEAARKRMSSR